MPVIQFTTTNVSPTYSTKCFVTQVNDRALNAGTVPLPQPALLKGTSFDLGNSRLTVH